MPSLTLVVLRTADLARSRLFYELVGLEFVEERHGTGAPHLAARVGDCVFELYPAASPETRDDVRLGFRVASWPDTLSRLSAAGFPTTTRDNEHGVSVDPDGRKVELGAS